MLLFINSLAVWFLSSCLQDLNKRQGLALLTKVGESVKHVAGGYKLRARPPEFCAMGEYLDTFTQKLGTIDRISQRILKEQSGSRWPDETLTEEPEPRVRLVTMVWHLEAAAAGYTSAFT